jgi:hypothetical protein
VDLLLHLLKSVNVVHRGKKCFLIVSRTRSNLYFYFCSAAQAMDQNGNLFFGMIANNAIGCWNTHKPYNLLNIRNVAQNPETMQFISGMKVIKNRKGKEELWILSCRFQVMIMIYCQKRKPN